MVQVLHLSIILILLSAAFSATTSARYLTVELLKKIAPNAKLQDCEFYVDALNNVWPKYEINTNLRWAHFLAQILHESGSLYYKVENWNYSAAGWRSVFGKYFPTLEEAEKYARQPEKIANRVYSNRMGNGDEASGEGWKYRGRGLIQWTGKNNYRSCGAALGIDLVNSPDLCMENAEVMTKAACWYWSSKNLNSYADQDDIRTITKLINGGYNGLEDRTRFLIIAKTALGL